MEEDKAKNPLLADSAASAIAACLDVPALAVATEVVALGDSLEKRTWEQN